jgi:hypothetical protein
MTEDLGDCAMRTAATREPNPVSRFRPVGRVSAIAGPSRSFIELTRNIELAEQAPRRFEPTVKGANDVVI